MNPTRRGFPGIYCPVCEATEDELTVELAETSHFHCSACGEIFTVEDVADLPEWAAVVAWIQSAPPIEE
jgi:transposase-like protein